MKIEPRLYGVDDATNALLIAGRELTAPEGTVVASLLELDAHMANEPSFVAATGDGVSALGDEDEVFSSIVVGVPVACCAAPGPVSALEVALWGLALDEASSPSLEAYARVRELIGVEAPMASGDEAPVSLWLCATGLRAGALLCLGVRAPVDEASVIATMGVGTIGLHVGKDEESRTASEGVQGLLVARAHVEDTFCVAVDASAAAHEARLARLPQALRARAQYWLLAARN